MKKFITILLILLSLTPVLWFLGKPDILINGIDTNFPLNPLVWIQRRLFVWSSVPNAGVDFSSSTAGLFFHLIQAIPYAIYLKLQVVEVTSFIFWFGLIIFGANILAKKLFIKKPLIQLLFVVLYAFNIYMFNTWENVKVANLALVAAIPYAISLLISLRNNQISRTKSALVACIIGVILSGAGINPAYFISFFSILFAFLLSLLLADFRNGTVKVRIVDFLFVSFFIVFVNFYWLLPTLNFIFNNITPQGSIQNIGFTNWVDSLSENTSIANILRLQGAWDWYAFDSTTNLPLYIPYALRFFHDPIFIAFSVLIPALAFLSFTIRKKTYGYLYIFWGMLLLTGVFLGVGTHSPTGGLFKFFASHVPFFSLFRSPWYIFTPMLTLSYAGLVGLLFYSIEEALKKSSFKLFQKFIPLLVFTLVLGNLVYSYPLVLGRIFRPGRPDGFFVSFPNYIFDAAKWLTTAQDGRLIAYPDDEIENFQWHYRGIESVLTLVSNREVLYPPLNAANEGIAVLIRHFYSKLKKSEISAANSLASKLNVRYLFEKLDQNTLAIPLDRRLSDNESKKFTNWQFNEIPDQHYLPKISSSNNFVFAYPYSKGSDLLTALGRDTHILNPSDDVVTRTPGLDQKAGEIVLSKNSFKEDFENVVYNPATMSSRLLKRNLQTVSYTFEVRQKGQYAPILERYKLEEFGLDPAGVLEVSIDGVNQLWRTDSTNDSFVRYQRINLNEGEHTVNINLKNINLILGGTFEDEANIIKSIPSGGEGRFDIIPGEEGSQLSIHNLGDRDVTAEFHVSNFDPLAVYLIQFKYRQIYGNNGLVIFGQNAKTALVKTQVERLPNYPEWQDFSFFYDPVKTESELKVHLSSPATKDPLGTKILYDDLEVYKVFSNNLIFLKEQEQSFATPDVSFEAISPVEYRLKVKNASDPHAIVFLENYSNFWQLKAPGIQPLHFSIDTYANAWYIDNAQSEYEATLYYKPQDIYKFGILVSIVTILLAVGLYIKERVKV